jgi:hypothetical protein
MILKDKKGEYGYLNIFITLFLLISVGLLLNTYYISEFVFQGKMKWTPSQ